jgi:peptide chain release factor subunit 1
MTLSDQLDRLAAFEPAPYPVVSLYLNTQPGPNGRDQFQTFVRKEFAARSRTYPEKSPERESLDRDVERIGRYLEVELQPSTNGVAIFACSAGELFEAVQLSAPIDRHWLYIGDQPHLYPLARLESQHPRYAAVLADTASARILVFALGEVVANREVKGVKTRKSSQGGWSQARYQRHIENFHLHHAKEVVDALDRIVTDESIDQVLLAGDAVILPLLREQMPKHLAEKVVDRLRVETNASLDDVMQTSFEAMKRINESSDRERVEAALGAYRAGGLGVAGPEETLDALTRGQVDELLITANLQMLQALAAETARPLVTASDSGLPEPAVEPASAGEAAEADPEAVRLADELVTRARQTGAAITFIEDPALLAAYGGAAAILRFRL